MHGESDGLLSAFAALTADARDCLGLLSPHARFAFVSAACEQVLGYGPGELTGRSFLEGMVRDVRTQVEAALHATRDGEVTELEFERRDRQGRQVSVQAVLRPYPVEGDDGWVVVTMRLAAQATDVAGRLHTRGFFLARLQDSIERKAVEPRHQFVVLVMQINEAQLIEAGAGREQARRLVADAALRLKRQLGRRSSVAVIDDAQLGLLLEANAETPLQPDDVAKFCQDTLDQPFQVDGHDVVVTAVTGMVVGDGRRARAEELLAQALAAKSHAMRLGGGGPRAQVFGTFIGREDKRRFRMAIELPKAIKDGQLDLHYQPLVDLFDLHMAGVEVLCRWNHAELGFVSPSEFIPFAEEMGQIIALDRSVLQRACREVMSWPAAQRPFLSANLSARQLGDPALVKTVAQVIEDTGIDPRALHLELTESAVAEDADVARRSLRDLKSLGVHLSLDDFGTGYSSFAYLADLPLDTLKIDRTFVARVHADSACEGIVHGVIAMARRLGLKVVAEGIELEPQLEVLRQLGADLGQGYLFSRPVPPDQLPFA